uniref:BZIP domain-containing protein n=1 Tax=Ascaris lumbricoides TaxID=6252 RepID=A0A0M3HRK1_ASCLU
MDSLSGSFLHEGDGSHSSSCENQMYALFFVDDPLLPVSSDSDAEFTTLNARRTQFDGNHYAKLRTVQQILNAGSSGSPPMLSSFEANSYSASNNESLAATQLQISPLGVSTSDYGTSSTLSHSSSSFSLPDSNNNFTPPSDHPPTVRDESDFALRLKSRSRSPESYPFMRIKAKRNKLTIEEGSDGVIELTDEERSMLALEGYDVPMRLPLSNAEQKALKAVKRKIANKESARKSRQKKEQYVKQLERQNEERLAEFEAVKAEAEQLKVINRRLAASLEKMVATFGECAADWSGLGAVSLISFPLKHIFQCVNQFSHRLQNEPFL